jgi:chromosome segregation ATPase
MASNEKIVTDDLVFEIADRLTAEERKVSNRVIWSEIGGGSMTTIAAALRRWRERQELRTEHPIERAPLPEAIADAMREAVAQLWKTAQDETQKELDALTHAMNDRVNDATSERDEALAELQGTVEELETTRQQLAELTDAHQATGVELARISAEMSTVQDRAATAETRAAELEARVADLKAELDRAHAELQTERQEAVKARAEASRRIEAAEDKAAAEIRALQAQHQAELQRVRDDADKRVAEVKAAGDQALQEARKRAAEEIHRMTEKLQRLESGLDTANQEAKAAANENGKLRGQVEVLQAQVGQQQDTIKTLAGSTGAAAKKATGKGAGGEKA